MDFLRILATQSCKSNSDCYSHQYKCLNKKCYLKDISSNPEPVDIVGYIIIVIFVSICSVGGSGKLILIL